MIHFGNKIQLNRSFSMSGSTDMSEILQKDFLCIYIDTTYLLIYYLHSARSLITNTILELCDRSEL